MVALWRDQQEGTSRGSLLIAVPDDAPRRELDSLFRREGCRTHLATDDTEAVQIVRHERIDVVIVDLDLPRHGGLEVIRTLRQAVECELPCVVTALEVSGRVQMDALNEGAYAVVPKPFDEDLLKRLVLSLLAGGHLF